MRFIITIVSNLMFCSASLADSTFEPVLSPWSNKPYSQALTNSPLRMQFSFDNQLRDRNAVHWMEFIDWDLVQATINKKSQVTEDKILIYYLIDKVGENYISSHEVLESIKELSLSLYERLTQGLDLTRPALVEAQSRGDLRSVQNPGFIKSDALPQLGTQLEVTESSQTLLPNNGFERVRESDYSQLGIAYVSEAVSDWQLLNNRWNSLPLDEKFEVFKWKLLTPVQKVKSLSLSAIMISLGISSRSGANFFSHFSKNLPPEYEGLVLNTEPTGTRGKVALEFSLDKPMSNAVDFLDYYHAFNQRSSRLYYLQNPGARTGFSDGDYHLHISVEREEGIAAIVEAWNHLIVFSEIKSGNDAWFDRSNTYGSAFFKSDIKRKGLVRLISENHVEIRTQIFTPEDTLMHLTNLFQMTNEDAVRYIYQELSPNLSQENLIRIAADSPELFSSLINQEIFVESLDFELNQSFKDRVYTYLKERLSDAKALDLSKFEGFIGLEKLLELREVYSKAVDQLSQSKAFEKIRLAVGTVNDGFLIEGLSLKSRINYLETLFSDRRRTDLSILDLSEDLLQDGLKEIIDWYADRVRSPLDRPYMHADFLNLVFLKISEDPALSDSYLVDRLSPQGLSWLMITSFQDQDERVHSILKNFSDADLDSAVKFFIESKELTSAANIDLLISWLQGNSNLSEAFFRGILSSEQSYHVHQVYLNYLISSKHLSDKLEQYRSLIKDFKASNRVALNFEGDFVPQDASTLNGIIKANIGVKSCTSLLN